MLKTFFNINNNIFGFYNMAMKEILRKHFSPSTVNILRVVYRSGVRMSGWVVGVPLISFLLLLEPMHRIRFYHLGEVNHFGWLGAWPDQYLRKWQIKKREGGTHIFLMYNPGNKQLMAMWKRALFVVDNIAINKFADFVSPSLSKTRYFISSHKTKDYWNIYPKIGGSRSRPHSGAETLPSLYFTEEEEEIGKAGLREMGIAENDWFVCFHSRDEAHYSSKWMPHMKTRNSKVESYLKAAELIVERGGYAIRMGAHVEHSLPHTINNKIIDYASNYRSDFMDIYLLAKTKFFLGNTSGVFSVPFIFNKPCIFANHASFNGSPFPNGSLWAPKLIRRISSGEILHFDEVAKLGMLNPSAEQHIDFKAMGLQFIENTADDIHNMCMDMFDQIEGIPPSKEAALLQKRFREKFKVGEVLEISPDISPSFILTHKDRLI